MTATESNAREPMVGRAPATVCGVGAVTGYGWGRKRLWDGLESGESAVVASTGWEESLGHDVAYMAKIADVPHEGDPRSRFARATETAVDEAIDILIAPICYRILFSNGEPSPDYVNGLLERFGRLKEGLG